MNGIQISGPPLFLAGAVVVAVLALVVRVRAGNRRARAVRAVARLGTSPVSILGRVLVTAGAIVGTQWVVITYAASNHTLLWVVLAVPALVAAYAVTKALTVTQVGTSSRRSSRRRASERYRGDGEPW